MDASPLISVVVPIYNVEKFLEKCLSSICNQSYKNLEILLVDDGSTDHCGAICDAYAGKDARIQVLHQSNQGLSAARNAGIERASGDYLGFVDGDDWIEPTMFQSLLDAMIQHQADIAACQFRYVFSNGTSKIRLAQPFEAEGRQMIVLLLEGERIQDYVCNKLFSARLFNSIRFPVGKAFEDISTTYRLFERAARLVSLAEPLYCYFQRKTGIVRTELLKNEMDCYWAKYERYRTLSIGFPDGVPAMLDGLAQSAVKVWGNVWKERKLAKDQYRQELKEISKFIQRKSVYIKQITHLGVTVRCTLALTRFVTGWAFWMSGMLRRAYQWKSNQA